MDVSVSLLDEDLTLLSGITEIVDSQLLFKDLNCRSVLHMQFNFMPQKSKGMREARLDEFPMDVPFRAGFF